MQGSLAKGAKVSCNPGWWFKIGEVFDDLGRGTHRNGALANLGRPGEWVVLCMDEKPHTQVIEPAQGWLRRPTGRALTGQTHDDRRHGTTTPFRPLTP